MSITIPTTRRGGTIPELLAGAAALALLAALILPAAARFRADSRTASSLSQLRWLGGVTSSYGADNTDRFWSYSWKAGPLPHSDPTLPATAHDDLRAAAIQAIDILRRRGRPDIPLPAAWVPHILYNHLPLLDYLDRSMPDFNIVSPADATLLAWARDPEAFDRGEFLPHQPFPSDSAKRWPYTSSYEVAPAFFDISPDPARRMQQGGSDGLYSIPFGGVVEGAPLPDITFPASKILLFEKEQWSLGAQRQFSLVESSRIGTVMADGSAGVVTAAEANPGWKPRQPTDPEPSRFDYRPGSWMAPTTTGGLAEPVVGRFRWTRGGIAGRDFGGPEVDTGQP